MYDAPDSYLLCLSNPLYQYIVDTVLFSQNCLVYLFAHPRCSAGFPCHDAQVSSDALDDAAATIQYIASQLIITIQYMDSIHQS